MRVISVTPEDIEDFKGYVIRRRSDWPAVFSCNNRGDIWLFVTYGYTEESDRVKVDHPFLATIAEGRLDIHPIGGRFFVDERGAFWKDEDGEERMYLRFDIGSRARPVGRGSR